VFIVNATVICSLGACVRACDLGFSEARDSERQWHQLGCMQVSLQIDNHASTLPLSFLQAGCSSCRSVGEILTRNYGDTFLPQPAAQKVTATERVHTVNR